MESQVYEPTESSEVKEVEHCKNCGAVRRGEFCHNCGQHYLDGSRLNFSLLWREFAKNVTQLEKGLIPTLLGLVKNPGRVIREYIGGRRKAYLNPITFVIIAGATSLVITNLFMGARMAELEEFMVQSAEQWKSILNDSQHKKMVEYMIGFAHQPTNTYFMMAAPFALGVRVFFSNARINLVESFIYCLYTTGLFIFIGFLTAPIDVVVSFSTQMYLSYVIWLITVVYVGLSFFGYRLSVAIKIVITFFLSFIAFSILSSAGMILLSILTG